MRVSGNSCEVNDKIQRNKMKLWDLWDTIHMMMMGICGLKSFNTDPI